MSGLIAIDLVFKNTDYLTVDAEHILDLDINDIYSNLILEDGHMKESKYSRCVCICLDKRLAYVPYSQFVYGNMYGKEGNAFDRIYRNRDLVCIELHYSDGSEEKVYVDWYSRKCQFNENQKSKYDSEGNFCIVIGRGKCVEYEFRLRHEFVGSNP